MGIFLILMVLLTSAWSAFLVGSFSAGLALMALGAALSTLNSPEYWETRLKQWLHQWEHSTEGPSQTVVHGFIGNASVPSDGDWYTNEHTGTHSIDWDEDQAALMSLLLTRDGKVGWVITVDRESYQGKDAKSPEFVQAVALWAAAKMKTHHPTHSAPDES